MPASVIVLNGGSSSGKSTLARILQNRLREPWLSFSVDTFVSALPPSLEAAEDGIRFDSDGTVTPGPSFRELETAWMHGIAAMARAGAHIIIDDVFLGGREGQERWRAALRGLEVLWVGVHCDPEVAGAREAARGDRIAGMARAQALIVHQGVEYDVAVDTTAMAPAACARAIADKVARPSR